MLKRSVAELLGTFWLVFGGCGSAVLAAAFPDVGIGLLGVSLAFGLTVVTMAYAVGHISGGHFNPAVTLGLLAGGRVKVNKQKSLEVFTEKVSKPLGLDTYVAAEQCVDLVNVLMREHLVRTLMVGHDLRDYVLLGYAGGGPLHARFDGNLVEARLAIEGTPATITRRASGRYPPSRGYCQVSTSSNSTRPSATAASASCVLRATPKRRRTAFR